MIDSLMENRETGEGTLWFELLPLVLPREVVRMSTSLGGFDGRGSGVSDKELIVSLRDVNDRERDGVAADSTIENPGLVIDRIDLAESMRCHLGGNTEGACVEPSKGRSVACLLSSMV